jgi:hypothetical protein
VISTLLAKLRAWLSARAAATPLRIVATRPLHGGAAVYVADIDGRRLVFAAHASAACLLASYDLPSAQPENQCSDPSAARVQRTNQCNDPSEARVERRASRLCNAPAETHE